MAWNSPRVIAIYQGLSFEKWRPRTGNESAYLAKPIKSVKKLTPSFHGVSELKYRHTLLYYASQMCILQIEGNRPPPATRLQTAELQYSLSGSGLEPNPQYLQGLPVNNLQENPVQACNFFAVSTHTC